MTGQIQPGPTLMPGEPRYERLAEAFATMKLDPLRDGAPIHALANLLPMITDEGRRETLRASLDKQGQNHPAIFFKGLLLDGRNRTRELIALRKPVSTCLFIGSDVDALDFVDAENFQRRHLTESQRADYAARVATLRLGANQHTRANQVAQICTPSLLLEGEASAPVDAEKPPLSSAQAAEKYNVSRRLVNSAKAYQRDGIPELSEKVQAGEMKASVAAEIAARPQEEQKAILDALPRDETGKLTPEAKKQVRTIAKEVRAEDQAEKKKKRAEKEAKLAAKILALPETKAGLILSDFEWHFKVRSAETGMDRHAANHYVTAADCDTAEAIVERARARMEVAADDCVHLMWVPACFSAIGHRVMELQGFTYVSQFVWVKPGIGTGFWVRDAHELLFIGVRGKIMAPSQGEQFRSVIDSPKGEHSEKPDFQYQIAEHYFPTLPKIELNARRFREGWIQWGNEAPEAPDQAALALDTEEQAA